MNKHFIDRDKVMDRREFYRLPRSDQRSLMATWRLTKSTEQIKKEMNLSTTAFYSLLKRLDLPTNLKAHRDASPSLLGERAIEASKENRKISDQDIINEYFQEITPLDYGYNMVREINDK